jgi:hypothetical protein
MTPVDGRLYVLAVGVNEYVDSRANLKSAAADAEDVAESFALAVWRYIIGLM